MPQQFLQVAFYTRSLPVPCLETGTGPGPHGAGDGPHGPYTLLIGGWESCSGLSAKPSVLNISEDPLLTPLVWMHTP